MILPEKPKDKWINAKDFSWFFEYDNESNISEEDWYFYCHMSLGMIMQTLADEADHNGIEIIRCKDCEWYCGHERYCSNDIFARADGFCFYGIKKVSE